MLSQGLLALSRQIFFYGFFLLHYYFLLTSHIIYNRASTLVHSPVDPPFRYPPPQWRNQPRTPRPTNPLRNAHRSDTRNGNHAQTNTQICELAWELGFSHHFDPAQH